MSNQVARRHHQTEHLPQLDGLRALAVFAVLVTHYVPDGHWLKALANWGEIGVQLFFVLSGFLITGILLRCRRLVDGGSSRAFVLRQFYVRRFLRIFPLFYVTILVLAVARIGYMRETWPWHAAYLSNVALVLKDGGLGHTTHFWTLAVEEQFYLVWPMLILMVPQRALLPVLCGITVAAPLFRLSAAVAPVPYFVRYSLPPACLDALGAGSLLAFLRSDRSHHRVLHELLRFSLPIGGCSLLALLVIGTDTRIASALNTVFFRLALAGVFFWLVNRTISGFRGGVGAALGAGPLVYLGRISYGVYVLHHFASDILDRVAGDWAPAIGGSIPGRFLVWSTVSVALASISWYSFEKPLNDLKSYFPYGGSRETMPSSRPVTLAGVTGELPNSPANVAAP